MEKEATVKQNIMGGGTAGSVAGDDRIHIFLALDVLS